MEKSIYGKQNIPMYVQDKETKKVRRATDEEIKKIKRLRSLAKLDRTKRRLRSRLETVDRLGKKIEPYTRINARAYIQKQKAQMGNANVQFNKRKKAQAKKTVKSIFSLKPTYRKRKKR